ADLVRKVKLMVRSAAARAEAPPSGLKRAGQPLSAFWATRLASHVPRFAAELTVACLAVLVVLRVGGWTITRQPPPLTPAGVSQVDRVADLSPQEQTLLARLTLPAAPLLSLDKRIVLALENLPKTLVLEETRGPSNVAIYKRAAPATVL